jgi:hypothetical protein
VTDFAVSIATIEDGVDIAAHSCGDWHCACVRVAVDSSWARERRSPWLSERRVDDYGIPGSRVTA